MSTEIDIISNIPINYVMVDHFAKNIGLSEQKMNKLKKHAYQNGCKFLVRAPDGHVFMNINLFNIWLMQNNFAEKDLKINQLPYILITAEKYASITGYTYKAIERKKEDKVWNTRVVFRDPLGNLTVNIIAAEKWIEEGFKNGK
jgi:hypothetical protein